MRRSIPYLAILGLLAASAAVTFPAAGADPDPPAGLADRDGNGISDDLQLALADARPDDTVDVVVTFRGPADVAAAQQRVGRFAVGREFQLIDGFAATMRAAQVEALAAAPNVFRVEADFAVTTTNDAANRDFGAEAARTEFGVDGDGVEVCVVDTGVDPDHEQFVTKTPIPFFDAINGQPTAYDDNGHGTHVAGIAVGDGTGTPQYAGVAPKAALSAAKVLSSSGSGSASQVIAGIEWCADRDGAVVISMSLGTAGGSDGQDSISQAVNAAVTDKGKPVVVAAGNSGDAPETVGSPGAAEHAITVAAVAEWSAPEGAANHSKGVHLAPWSSRGPTLDGRTKPDISAPGMTITSARAGGGYATFSGTSMATPFVSGAVALAWSRDPELGPSDLKGEVTGTAQERGPEGQDNDWGWGLIDVLALVDAVADGGSGSTNAFPVATHVVGSVADHGTWEYEFEVTEDGLGVPIAVTMIIDGEFGCALWFFGLCWAYEWTGPDLDAGLYDPDGTLLDLSECPLGCHSNSIGRQETLTAGPTGAGTYTIEVYPYEGNPNDGQGGSFRIDLSHGPAGDTAPEPPLAGAVAGTVTDGSSEPIAGATVVLEDSGHSATTDANGTYLVDDVVPGDYTVTASADGYETASQSINVVEDETATADFALAPLPAEAGSLSGTVTDDDSGAGIEGATIDLASTVADGPSYPATTDGNGDYLIEEVEPGEYLATVSAPDYEDSSAQAVTIEPGELQTLDVALTPVPGEDPPDEDTFELTVVGSKERGLHKADLSWTGSNGGQIDVYRDEEKVATFGDTGSYRDDIDNRGSQTYTYQVCEAGTDTCSNEVVVQI